MATTPNHGKVPANPPSPHSPHRVIDLTNDPEPDARTYPTIGELLHELDGDMLGLDFTRYEEEILNAGFHHIHQVIDRPEVQQSFDRLAIPVTMRQEIFERASRMVHRAGKLKQITKTDEDDNPPI